MTSENFYFLLIYVTFFLSIIKGIVTFPLPVSMKDSNAIDDQNLNNTLLKRSPLIVETPNDIMLKLDNMRPNPWPSTLGRRLKKKVKTTRLEVASSPIQNYYPPGSPLSTVCMGSTIPYGTFKIMDWIKREVYKRAHVKRPFYRDLRRQMFDEGNSEECHTTEYSKFREFQECSIRRNQRMEFNVPKYPMIQKDK